MGERKRRSGTCATKKQAEKAARDALVSKDKGELSAPSKITFGDWLNTWLERREGKYALKTLHGQRYLANHYVIPVLGKIRLQELSKADLQSFYDSLNRPVYGHKLDQPIGASIQRQIHCVIKPALNEALKLDHISRNPANEVKPDPIKKSVLRVSEANVWTIEEALRFLQAARVDRYGYVFEFMLLTGTRKGEACGLRWVNVHLEESYLMICENRITISGKALNSTVKTAASNRKIYLSHDIHDLLERVKLQQLEDQQMHPNDWEGTGWVFTHARTGQPTHPDNLDRTLARITTAAGVKRITIHGIRHTHASLAAAQGVKPEVLSKQLGHTRTSFTLDVYRTVYESERKDYALDLSALVTPESLTDPKKLN